MTPKLRRDYSFDHKRRLPGRRKAVTIAVGFLCQDGIAICTDRQLTGEGGFKFEESKIAYAAKSSRMVATVAYSGDPDDASVMFQEISDKLEAEIEKVKGKGKFPNKAVRVALESIYRNKHAKRLQTIVGVRLPNHSCSLYRTSGHRVVEGVIEHIGGGDSSVLRFVSDFLFRGTGFLRVDDARILGDYLVSIASRYVDGCSGGPDHIIIRMDGKVSTGTGGAFSNWRERLLAYEGRMGEELRGMLLSGS